jgi:hypothetical protein
MSKMRIDEARGGRHGNVGAGGGVSPAHCPSLSLSIDGIVVRPQFPCFLIATAQFLIETAVRLEIG